MGVKQSEELDEVLDDEFEQEELEDRGDEVDPDLPDLDDDADDTDDDKDDDEPGEEEPAAETAGKKVGSKMVPHARFNEVNDQLKAERDARLKLEEELARARGAQPREEAPAPAKQEAAAAFDFDEAEDRYTDAIMEGDTAAARAIRAEIRKEERVEAERAATQVVEARQARESQAREQQALVDTAAELYKVYPQLNGASDKADADLIEMTLALRNRNIERGDSPSVALRKAAEKVCGAAKVELDDGDGDEGDDGGETRQERVIRKNLARDARIPPRELGAGERSRPVNYADLSEEEFDNLPEREKKKARGDFL